jgi:glyoxylase-like metal-dependent hydrolase (beta-lactamase superfamily II)
MAASSNALPAGVAVLERGWLSSNCIVLVGADHAAVVDSGYGLHAPHTLALVAAALQGRAPDLLVNTHLHSDHCGGNAALQAAYPALQTLIPPGLASEVARWDEDALGYRTTGQTCPQFAFDATLQPGSELRLGMHTWQVHAAPGHDPHSVVLFEPASRTLISADALWERGFGVVFPELDGMAAFDEVAQTLDLIEALQPALVLPGHGAPFSRGIAEAIAYARKRLDGFAASPSKHRQYAAKVLLKFKLLEAQRMQRDALTDWASRTPYLRSVLAQEYPALTVHDLIARVIDDLLRSGAASVDGNWVANAG